MSSELLSPADVAALWTPEGVSVQSFSAWTGKRLYQVTHGRIRLTLNEGEAVALLSALQAEIGEHQPTLLDGVLPDSDNDVTLDPWGWGKKLPKEPW